MQSKNCDFYKAQLFDYTADLLSDDERTALLSHIQSCPECMTELKNIESLILATSSIPDLEVPSGLKENIFKNLPSGQTNPAAKKRIQFRRFVSVALPAVACIALAIGMYSGGITDKFINSDSIISTGIDTSANTESTAEEISVDVSGNKNADTTPAYTEKETKTGAIVKSSKPDGKGAEENTSQNADDATADRADVASIQNDLTEVQQPKANNEPITVAEIPADADIPSVASSRSGARISEPGDDVSQGGGSLEDTVQSFPYSCIVKADDLSAFEQKYAEAAQNGSLTIEIPLNAWQEFLDFVSENGAEITTEYSNESTNSISITIYKE